MLRFPRPKPVPASDTLPAFCLVQGMINKRIGAGGKQFGIGFELRLPDMPDQALPVSRRRWAGWCRPAGYRRDSHLGIHGRACLWRAVSQLRQRTQGIKGKADRLAPRPTPRLALTSKLEFDQAYGGFMAVTELARQMIAHYYGQPWKKSYFMGCSNGGRQALLAAQRSPLAFDGVMSVAPAARVGTATISSVWETIAFSEIAPKDTAGTPHSFQNILEWGSDISGQRGGWRCDSKDGVKDGLIFDTRDCHFDPADLVCKGRQDGHLSFCRTRWLQ